MRNSRRFRFVLLANSEFIYNGAFCRPDLEITPQLGAKQLPGERPREYAEMRHTSPQPSRHVRRKGAAPLSGAEEQTARAFKAYALCACLLSVQMGSIN